jgi:hypothetical protein
MPADLKLQALRELTAWYPHWNGAPMGWYKVTDVLAWLEALGPEMVTAGPAVAGESRQEEVTEVNIITPACGKLG